MRNYIVAESIDGRIVKTLLEKETAQTLYMKIRSAGGVATIYEDIADKYLTDLFMVGGLDIMHLSTATMFKDAIYVPIEHIKDDSELLLDAIQKVKYHGWELCPF